MSKIREVKGERSIMDIEKLLENPKNANEHPQSQIDDIVKSMKLLWFRGEIVIDENNTILCGHGRVLAGKQIGLKKVPVVKYSDLTEAEKISYMNLDNRLPSYSTLNIEKLQENFTDIEALGGTISDLEKDLFDFAIPDIEIGEMSVKMDENTGQVTKYDPKVFSEQAETVEDTDDIEAELQKIENPNTDKWVVRGIQVPVKQEIYDETFKEFRKLLDSGVDVGVLFYNFLKNENAKNDES